MASQEALKSPHPSRQFYEFEDQIQSQLLLSPLDVKSWEWNAISRTSFVINTHISGNDFVIKIPRPEFKTATDFAKENKNDYTLLKRYFDAYIPPTYFIQSPSNHGEGFGSSIVIQERVPGIPLADIAIDELEGHPRVANSLRDIIRKSIRMFAETKRIPDLFGGYPPPVTFREKSLKNSRNILVDLDSDQVFLVDIVCPAKLHSIIDASPRQKISILNQARRMLVFYSELGKYSTP